MTDGPADGRTRTDPVWYEIRIGTVLDAHWATRFDGLRLTVLDDATTRLAGPVVDESALHAILDGIRDLRLPLLLVRRIPPEPKDPSHGSPER